MILRKNQDLFNLIKGLSGVNKFTTSELGHLLSFTNKRLITAYNQSPMWSRYVVVSEKRKISSFSISGITDVDVYNTAYYKYGDFTQSAADGSGDFTSDFFVPINQIDSTNNQNIIAFYKNTAKKWVWGLFSSYSKTTADVVTASAGVAFATQQETDIKDHPTDVEDWGSLSQRTGFLAIENSNVVSYDETYEVLAHNTTRVSKTPINEFIRIHRKKAFLNDSTTEYDFYVDSYGANVLNSSATDQEVFVTYKKNIINTSTNTVITSLDEDGTSQIQEIPNEFFSYVAHGVYADFLRLDGQTEKSLVESNEADALLALELEQIDIINNRNSLNHKFSTYINTSSR